MKEFLKKPLTRTTAIIMAVVLVAIWYVLYQIYVPLDRNSQKKLEVSVVPGQGLSEVAKRLNNLEIIRSEFFFKVYVKLSGQEGDLKAGRYLLSQSFSISKIAAIITGGLAESDDVVVVVPEGFNVWEIDDRLFQAGLLEREGDFARLYLKDEGHLFPDTYRFDPKLKDEATRSLNPQIISNIMKDNYFAKAGNTSRDNLILASMLEKEGRREEDMRMISGVIKNRIEIGMLFEIDATVGYGWCLKRFREAKSAKNCDVTQAPIALELSIDGPYNTYMQKGLPEGPISNPGLKAINAASNPIDHDYLYYLSTRDGSQIIFSKTGAEHAQNRRKHLGL